MIQLYNLRIHSIWNRYLFIIQTYKVEIHNYINWNNQFSTDFSSFYLFKKWRRTWPISIFLTFIFYFFSFYLFRNGGSPGSSPSSVVCSQLATLPTSKENESAFFYIFTVYIYESPPTYIKKVEMPFCLQISTVWMKNSCT